MKISTQILGVNVPLLKLTQVQYSSLTTISCHYKLTYSWDFGQGITTYDYILAVREQEQGQEQDHGEGDGFNSLTSSPASSNITGISAGFSSMGASSLHRGVFCTPPRMFVEHQQVRIMFNLRPVPVHTFPTQYSLLYHACNFICNGPTYIV